ncbi:uncharacterized protein LOC131164228 [Malania oleifera]|uniref:uncharacterized protein LOC131164228 n=1 Tax=Malania oleifera TaxID=397392 RepID=UPI0025AE8236|nr:uncharacterized protein LOC131164228 [Malania oleifera]
MEGRIADELYSDTLRLSNVELDPTSTVIAKQGDMSDCNEHDLLHEDGSFWDDSDEEMNRASDLDREWQRRRNQFHTIGYRDGVIAGKEASAQEGFNVGFKQSMLVGYDWGLVRGVSSALACLPDELKDKLVETHGKREKFNRLYESVHALSTTDALKLFHDDIVLKKLVEKRESSEGDSHMVGLKDQSSDSGLLGNYFGELQTLLRESPAVGVHLLRDQ